MIGREALYYEYQCAYFNYKVGNDKTEISFAFQTENYFYHIVICKDFGSNKIYFDKDLKPRCEIDKKIIMKYYDKLLELLFILEEYNILFEKGSFCKDVYKNKVLKVMLSYFYDGTAKVRIFNNSELLNNEFLGRDSFDSIVNDNEVTLLKKIPIEISSLDDKLKDMVDEYYYGFNLEKTRRKAR